MSDLQREELAIQKEIRFAEDQLVLWIQKHMDDFEIHARQVRQKAERENDRNKKNYGKLEESQFRNVIRVAETTDSPEVIKNFLLYQLGRDNKWGAGKDSLAVKIIADIGSADSDSRLYTLAHKVAHGAASQNIHSIWLDLIRRYLGYGSRYLVYLNKKTKRNK
ncbi:MAG: hypothetical protein HC936_13805 [Leptolyngbyaceae cyanobacterium SU_3_3]|nr:hypothetical protein [Leptolyngbyaceae cyanobacterium SU_3_3]NJR49872.1 hypothetical protein [Leptolyngbyaceae cyanobacterium CSU_1_3]